MGTTLKIISFIFVSIVGIFAVVAAVYAVLSLYKSKSAQRYLKQAHALLRERKETEALAMFLKAEASWELNSYDGGRESLLRDLGSYKTIAGNVFKILGRHAGPVRPDIQSIIAEMTAYLRDRSNFGIDGRKMKIDSAQRWVAMCERLETLRNKLREACQPEMVANILAGSRR